MPKMQNDENTLDVVRKNLNTVLGNSGTEHYGGYFSEEPNSEWRDERRVENVEKMRRTDAAIKAVLNALKAPILSTSWDIEGEDEEIVSFVWENIFEMERSWTNFLREALTFLDFGFSVFEMNYEIKNGRIYLKDLAPRIQHSIEKWKLDDGSFGVVQRVRNDDKMDGVTVAYGTIEIPRRKLLVLTNDMEGDDITGQSILRPAWKHFVYKELLYKIQGIAAERYGVGIPVITLPEDYGEADKNEAEEAAQYLKSNEKAYVVLPPNFDLKILTPQGNPQGSAIEGGITHHNKMILMSVLASFLGLGTDTTGSFALSKDQSSFFLKHVEDKTNYFANEFTKQVIAPLVRLNFGGSVEVPRLTFTQLGDVDFNEMSTVLKTLVDAGLLQSTEPRMQQFTRTIFKLPELSDEQVEEMEIEAELSAMEEDMSNDEFAFTDEPEEEVPDVSDEEPEEDEEEEEKPEE